MRYFESREKGLVIVSLGNGELLLESLREVAKQTGMHTGILLTGIGSLSRGRIHIVSTNEVPPEEKYFDLSGPLEVVSFAGLIAAYEPHIHIAMMDAKGRFHGGHLEEGCAILTLAEITLQHVPDLRLVRRSLDGSRVKPLFAE